MRSVKKGKSKNDDESKKIEYLKKMLKDQTAPEWFNLQEAGSSNPVDVEIRQNIMQAVLDSRIQATGKSYLQTYWPIPIS